LFKQSAGWKWVGEAPVKTSTLVSVEMGKDHIYTLTSQFDTPVEMARYEDKKSEPRLRPTTRGVLRVGEKVGEIEVRGRIHPVYDKITTATDAPGRGIINRGEDSLQFRPEANDGTTRIAAEYVKNAFGREYEPHTVYDEAPEARLKEIADYFQNVAKHQPDAPDVLRSYRAMADETIEQYSAMIAAGIKPEPYKGKGEPYASSEEMMRDVRENKHLYFLRTDNAFGQGTQDIANPLLEKSGLKIGDFELLVNDVFRVVHDYFGHTQQGLQFGPRGEFNAWKSHSRMYSEEAQGAVAAETLAQNAWVNFGAHLRRADGSIPKKGEEGYVPPQDRPFGEQKNFVVPADLMQFRPESGQTDTPEFKKWFGDSKVVDEQGKPLVVYHGSTKAGFTVFDESARETQKGRDIVGYYFTNSPAGAETYSGTRREAKLGELEHRGNYSVFLSMKKPLEVDFSGNVEQGVQGDWSGTYKIDGETFNGGMDDAARSAKEMGYDGLIARNVMDEGRYGQGYGWGDTTYVVFEPTQIKSATGNRGTFDPENPDIRYRPEGEAPRPRLTGGRRAPVKASGISYENISVAKSDTSLPKVVLETNPEELFGRIDTAKEKIANDPMRLADDRGWVEYFRDAGVWGDVLAAPPALRLLLERPTEYVDLLNGGYHGRLTKPGTMEAADAGLDATVEMRAAINGRPPEMITAMHHLWGILSRMLPPVEQESAWLRLISNRGILEQIQNSIDGSFSLTQEQWKAKVSEAMAATDEASNGRGNQGTANANSFYMMLTNWNGMWSRVSDVYTAPTSTESGRKFWSLNAGPVGIKNKVQRFIGLTFGIPGLIMDRWKFVELYYQQYGKAPQDYFKYSAFGTPEDPNGIYGVYGAIEGGNSAFSLAFYEGLESVLNRAIANSPELTAALGRHANLGGLHWKGWNAIKNEAVGHSSLDLTYDLALSGKNPSIEDILDQISRRDYYTEGLVGNRIVRFTLPKP
jgi:hypothetical protein